MAETNPVRRLAPGAPEAQIDRLGPAIGGIDDRRRDAGRREVAPLDDEPAVASRACDPDPVARARTSQRSHVRAVTVDIDGRGAVVIAVLIHACRINDAHHRAVAVADLPQTI